MDFHVVRKVDQKEMGILHWYIGEDHTHSFAKLQELLLYQTPLL